MILFANGVAVNTLKQRNNDQKHMYFYSLTLVEYCILIRIMLILPQERGGWSLCVAADFLNEYRRDALEKKIDTHLKREYTPFICSC
jgi:hypothetical protein